MALMTGFAEIGQAAQIPQPADPPLSCGAPGHIRLKRQPAEHPFVERIRVLTQDRCAGRPRQGFHQGRQARQVERRVAPFKRSNGFECMGFDAVDQVLIERGAVSGFAKRAEIAKAAGAACNLRQFRWVQGTMPPAIIFGRRSEGDVVDIQIQPHADGICRNEEIDLA